MPELPEVETVRRGLEAALVGARLAAVEQRRPDLRFPFPERFAERLTSQRIEALRRRAKYLIVDLDGAESEDAAPVMSATCPPVSRKACGRPSSSTSAWTFVVRRSPSDAL